MTGRHVLAGTGPRSCRPTPELVRRLDAIVEARAEVGGLVIISGMAEGFDELLARRAIALGVPFIAAVPNRGYGAYYWSAAHSRDGKDRLDEFNELLAAAAEVCYVCRGVYEGRLHSNFVRNQWMVDHSDELVVRRESGKGGGTADCFRRATEAKRPWVEV